MEEDYCSYEVAKLLKEKGFDEPCTSKYCTDGSFDRSFCHYKNSEINKDAYNAPTHQMAMKWLREVYKIHISVDVCPIYGKVKDEKGRNTCGLLYWHYIACGEWMNDKYNPNQKAFAVSGKSNEEAVEEALRYTLKNLIKGMGIIGDVIREVRDTTKESLEECGIDDLKDELKDVWKALKGE